MQVTIYGISHKKHTQHIAVKSIQSYHSALFSNFLGTFWEHSFPLLPIHIKAFWIDYLNRKSLYTYLCDRMSIQFSKFISVFYLEKHVLSTNYMFAHTNNSLAYKWSIFYLKSQLSVTAFDSVNSSYSLRL